ncbi:MAG: hypothetical protein A4E40_00313 [Methanoregulaceae archaeon PtaU1.Bin059]|nr:MAG: hypothetical protein A4E39_01167 [Methanoregulaceae archaeon PtaB.Bin152]OPY42742.1 MAG: hypothetical protein A4E40_00313 [Methanoregulaceae archaeon PtaU1.Bin059]
MHEPGTLSRGEDGAICIRAEDEHYFIPAEDVRSLLLTGKATPVLATRRVPRGRGQDIIEGYAVVGSGRRSVFFYSRAGHFLTPMVNFLRVARGEAQSAPLFPLFPGDAGAGI